ncbi:MAG: GGDEF domain-containing protein [Solirubrobacteraceae bacterium]|nr:GGDEF domain-containing protein [Solirubrobacteraceae bacterium]
MLTPRFRSQSLPQIPVATGSLVKWRYVAMLMLLAGGAVIEIGVLTGWVSTDRPELVQASAATFAILAAMTTLVSPKTYRLFSRVVILVAIAEITLLAKAFDGIVTVPIYYVWPLLAAAYLLTRIDVAIFSLLSLIGCAFGATAPELGLADYLSILTVSTVVIAAVRLLAENLGMTIKSLRSSSFTDPLTGLLNRRAVNYRVAEELRIDRHRIQPFTVLVLDIDHFKPINDRLGHAAGDAALVRFSELLVGACRGSDHIARMGGEEFAVVMPGASSSQALERAEAFADALRADRMLPEIAMTVSGGIATSTTGIADWDELLSLADDAVYAATRSGRDRLIVAPAPVAPGALSAVPAPASSLRPAR